MASGGLVQRINILADKSLLAAFNVNTHEIDVHRVKAVIKDSGIKRPSHLAGLVIFLSRRIAGATGVLAFIALGVLGWQALHSAQTNVISPAASVPMEMTTSAPVSSLSTPRRLQWLLFPVLSLQLWRLYLNLDPPHSPHPPSLWQERLFPHRVSWPLNRTTRYGQIGYWRG